MQRSNQYTLESRVRFSEVDHTRRITLPAIINYFQDCSTFHSESLGVGISYYAEHKRVWILSAWQVEVMRYPLMGEPVRVSTWATKFEGLLGLRNFRMEDEGQQTVAWANSVWVYMDLEKGRPTRPDRREIELYGTGDPLPMEYAKRKIEMPGEWKIKEPFPVRKYHIDTNEHVNNCQYVQMALEGLEKPVEVEKMRVEYKKSAVYGDVIYPKVAYEEDRTMVELSDENGNAYAVVELKQSL